MHKRRWFFGMAFLIAVGLILFSMNHAQSQSDLVKRGKYIVDAVGACGQCHTPRKGAEMDMSMYLAGHPAKRPIRSMTSA